MQFMSGQVPEAYNRLVANPRGASAYSVKLTRSFVKSDASCRVYGCYQESTVDNITDFHYPIQNATCNYPGKTTGFHCIFYSFSCCCR